MFKRILVPVDGSEPSNAAVDLAVRFALDQNARLAFVNVCDVSRIVAMMSGGGMTPIDPTYAIDAESAAGRDILREAVAKAGLLSASPESFSEDGTCVDSILAVAKRWKADLIVIGSHGRGGIARALLGSIAEGVLRHSPIPVLVMHVGGAVSVEVARDEASFAATGAAIAAGVPHEVDAMC